MDNEAPGVFSPLEQDWDCGLDPLIYRNPKLPNGKIEHLISLKFPSGSTENIKQSPRQEETSSLSSSTSSAQPILPRLNEKLDGCCLRQSVNNHWPIQAVKLRSAVFGDYRARMAPHSLGNALSSRPARECLDQQEKFDAITRDEIYDIIRHMRDPEHPDLSLEQLRVVQWGDITIGPARCSIEYLLGQSNFELLG
tara:strand:+ start:1683 stop:2270 length:588 start_codon:yes stop_codon:yes gene_type:complete